MNAMGCSLEEARAFKDAYAKGFPEIAKFKQRGSNFVRNNGYILICKKTGHKSYWEGFEQWREMENFTRDQMYAMFSKEEIKQHNKVASDWDRKSLNSPTQGTGSIILKYAIEMFFKWIKQEGYFGKVLLCNLVHDEAVVEFPEELKDIVPNKLKYFMEKAASVFCKSLPIPAVPEVGDHWIH